MAGGLAAIGAGFWAYRGHHEDLPGLQLAGSVEAARRVLSQDPHASTIRSALDADYLLIAGYTVGLALLNAVGWRCFTRLRARRVAGAAAIAALVAGVLDVVENLAVTQGLDGLAGPSPTGEVWWRVAAGADVAKLALLLPTAAVALVTVLVVGRRMVPRRRTARVQVARGPGALDDPDGCLPADVQHDRPAGRVGVCVSGGGIRSACVALGALQMLRPAGWLRDDGYLFSVSGGGYTTGALRLAMQPTEKEGGLPGADQDPPLYDQDTPELRHLREHGNYVAQGARQWVTALGVVLAHLFYSLFVLTAAAVAVGLVLGVVYWLIPLSGPGLERAFGEPARDTAGAAWLLGLLAAAAVLLWLIAGTVEGASGKPWRLLRAPAWIVTGLGALVVVLTLVVPALVWLTTPGVLVPIGGGSALLTALTALVTMASKRPKARAGGSRFGSEFVMPIAVVVVVGLLAFALLLAMAATVRVVVLWHGTGVSWLLLGLIASVVVATVAALFFDQTTASLHPFYRRRLNSAFATRRVGRRALTYRYSESTSLTTHGTKVRGFPALVFIATAEVTTPDGSPRPVPYTFASDWVGGAQLGYVPTAQLLARTPPSYRGDLTVLGAMAISGAAFASAMGTASKPFEVLLALSNARLGAWLPNPWWLARDDPDSRDWTRRRLPAVRSEAYHAREIVGSHPLDDPLLLVTDGGHYDNLGLVEALRHRCATVIVVDSSGDPPPYPTALLAALRLAHDELGVDVELAGLDDLAPGSVTLSVTLPQPLESLRPRLSQRVVVTGTITYPDGGRGVLVVVKTRLTADLPDDVLAYATGNPQFPYDSTADQWFDRDQFDAYHHLGRHLGAVAVETLAGLQGPGGPQRRSPSGNGVEGSSRAVTP